MMLEAAQYGDNSFVTLTYRPEALPEDMSVYPYVLSAFIKRLRKSSKVSLRYFGVGEYGDKSGHPHYHLALFNFPTCSYERTRHHVQTCCSICESITEAWGMGRIECGSLTPHSMAYVAGYINKKMTRDTDPRLEGRRPEFARMSLRPGIGLGMMHEVASTLMELGSDNLVDVPVILQHGMGRYPLGRYLRRNLRKMIGRSPNAPQEALDNYQKEMQPLREAAFNASIPLKVKVLEKSEGKRIQIEAKYKRNANRRTI